MIIEECFLVKSGVIIHGRYDNKNDEDIKCDYIRISGYKYKVINVDHFNPKFDRDYKLFNLLIDKYFGEIILDKLIISDIRKLLVGGVIESEFEYITNNRNKKIRKFI